jgi:RNA polymerase sigma-70 factor (ECF subfamily)
MINIHRDIVRRCKQNDPDAQYELYRLYNKAMFNACLRVTNSKEDAEDVLQEAFLSAFQHIRSFKEESTIGAWLKRIVLNHAINHVRKRRVEFGAFDQTIPENKSEPNTEDVDNFLLNSQVERIKGAMQKLPEGYRVVFSLYMLEGYDHREIAELLRISESTSKSQLNRAKNKLRELLNVEVNYG